MNRVLRASWFVASTFVLWLTGCAKLPPGQMPIDNVSIRGAKQVDANDVEEKIATAPSPRFFGVFEGIVYDYEVFNHATLQRDLARVERYYHARGYYDAVARAGRVSITSNNHVSVEILVQEGLPTVNDELVVTGIEKLPDAIQDAVYLAARADLPKNKPFEEDKFTKAEDDARAVLTDHGYAYATVKRDAFVDIVKRSASSTFAVVPGEPAKFGPITITGLDPDGAGPRPQELPEAPLRRALSLTEGQMFSSSKIESGKQALLDLEVFAAVTITPDLSHPETHIVPIAVSVEPTNLRQLKLGGGLELDEIKTELHGLIGWENHNLFGGLRDFSVDFTPGVVLYPTLITNFIAPDHFFPEEKLRAQLKQPGFLEARTQGFIRPEFNIFPLLVKTNPTATDPVVGYVEFKGSAGVDRSFFKHLYTNLSYDAQVEYPFSYKDGEVGCPIPYSKGRLHVAGTVAPKCNDPLDPALRTLIISYPELITKLDYSDDHSHPHKGFVLANDLQVAGGIFGGDAADVKIQPEVRTYVPVARKITFASRASLGFLIASSYGNVVQNNLSDPVTAENRDARVRDIETVLFRGFFSGGPTSNRGFPLRGIAPHGVVPFLNPGTAAQQVATSCDPPSASNGFKQPDTSVCSIPIGGFTLWEFSNELRFGISGPIAGAVFCDMSDVSQKEANIRLDHLHLSCGLGARYDTPVGPIRLDIGYRIQPLQVLPYKNETEAYNHDTTNGVQPTFFGSSTPGSGIPVALAIGIGEAY